MSYARCNAYASAKHEVVRKAPALPDRSRVLVRPLDVLQTGVISSVASQGSVEMSWHLKRMAWWWRSLSSAEVIFGSVAGLWAGYVVRRGCMIVEPTKFCRFAEQRLLEDFMLTWIQALICTWSLCCAALYVGEQQWWRSRSKCLCPHRKSLSCRGGSVNVHFVAVATSRR